MSGVADFLTAIGPALVELGKELFLSHDGDVKAATEHIEELQTVLRVGREEIDADARKKFGGR